MAPLSWAALLSGSLWLEPVVIQAHVRVALVPERQLPEL
jgi:hypothetical protein